MGGTHASPRQPPGLPGTEGEHCCSLSAGTVPIVSALVFGRQASNTLSTSNAAHRSLTHKGFCLVPIGKLLYLWTCGLQVLAEVRCPPVSCTFHTTVAAQRKRAGAAAKCRTEFIPSASQRSTASHSCSSTSKQQAGGQSWRSWPETHCQLIPPVSHSETIC